MDKKCRKPLPIGTCWHKLENFANFRNHGAKVLQCLIMFNIHIYTHETTSTSSRCFCFQWPETCWALSIRIALPLKDVARNPKFSVSDSTDRNIMQHPSSRNTYRSQHRCCRRSVPTTPKWWEARECRPNRARRRVSGDGTDGFLDGKMASEARHWWSKSHGFPRFSGCFDTCLWRKFNLPSSLMLKTYGQKKKHMGFLFLFWIFPASIDPLLMVHWWRWCCHGASWLIWMRCQGDLIITFRHHLPQSPERGSEGAPFFCCCIAAVKIIGV